MMDLKRELRGAVEVAIDRLMEQGHAREKMELADDGERFTLFLNGRQAFVAEIVTGKDRHRSVSERWLVAPGDKYATQVATKRAPFKAGVYEHLPGDIVPTLKRL